MVCVCDDPQIVTDESTSASIVSWSNIGFPNGATAGTYVVTGVANKPAQATGNFNGLMIHPNLSKIYVRGWL